MAISHENFKSYPIQIIGITAEYDDQLTAIEDFVRDEIAYTGTDTDIDPIIPYFVFYYFCTNKDSEVSASNGETHQVSEFTIPDDRAQVNAWNIGAKKLLALCAEKAKEANTNYQSQRQWI